MPIRPSKPSPSSEPAGHLGSETDRAGGGPDQPGSRLEGAPASFDALREQIGRLEQEAQARERSEDELRRRHQFVRDVIESLAHPFYVVDVRDYTVKLANSAAKFGDLDGQPTCYGLTHGRSEPCDGEHVCPLETLKRTKQPLTVEHVHYDTQGRQRNVEVHAHPILDAQGEVAQMIEYSLDVTDRVQAEREQRRLEARLRQIQKMEAVGTLAGGVAHDLNNMLAAVVGSASLLRRDHVPDDLRRSLAQRILDAASRGSALTQNLLGFARKGPDRHESVALGDTIGQARELLSRSVPRGVELRTQVEDGLAHVKGDANQLRQLLVSLCLNALHAAQPGGVVTIAARNCELGQEDLGSWPELEPGPHVRLEVIDDGVGMAGEVLERALDPFFTTREEGQGTGLGLSMAYGTATSHRGALHLESLVGEGTTASVLLPAREPPRAVAAPSVVAAVAAPPPSARVLVVDDEPLVLGAAQDMLEALGYSVLAAGSGAAALRLYERQADSIDVVLLDLSMPEMDGAECFRRLRALDPEARVVLYSGHSGRSDVEAMLAAGARSFLGKPFRLEQLERVIAAALEGG